MFCDCAANFRQFYLLLWKNFILQVSLNSVRGDSLLSAIKFVQCMCTIVSMVHIASKSISYFYLFFFL